MTLLVIISSVFAGRFAAHHLHTSFGNAGWNGEFAGVCERRLPSQNKLRFTFVFSYQEEFMMDLLKAFWADDQGQDLIEYTVLMVFVALASAALFLEVGGSISRILSTSKTQLAAASTSASSGALNPVLAAGSASSAGRWMGLVRK